MKSAYSKRHALISVIGIVLLILVFVFGCASKKKGAYKAKKGIKINELKELKVENAGESTKISIVAEGELAPNVFKLTDPLRVIIDLTDTRLGDVKGPISVDNGVINEITTSQFDDVTSSLSRVVIGFDKVVDYNVNTSGNVMDINIPKDAAAKAPSDEGITPEPLPEGEEVAAIPEVSLDEPVEAEIPELSEPVLDESEPGIEEIPEEPFETSMDEPVEEIPIDQTFAIPIDSQLKTATKIDDIQFETSDMGTTVYVTADGDIGEWDDFIVENPTRLVIDLKGIKNASSSKKKVNIGSEQVERLRVGEYKDKTRLVLDYPKKKKPSYTVSKEDKRLVLNIFSDVSGAAEETAQAPVVDELPIEDVPVDELPIEDVPVEEFAEEPVADVPPEDFDLGGPIEEPVIDEEPIIAEEPIMDEEPVIADEPIIEPIGKKATVKAFDFKQFPDERKSRIAIATDNPVNYTTRESSPGTIVLELDNTFIPKTSLRRFIDTSEFKSAVSKITPKYNESTNTSTFTVNLKESVAYNAYQDGNTLYIDFDIPDDMAQAQAPMMEKETPVAEEEIPEQPVVKAPDNLPEDIDEEDKMKWAPVKEEFLSDRLAQDEPLTAMGAVLAESYGGQQRFVGRRISLDFKNAEVRSIFRLLAEVSKFNMIIGDDVGGRITVRLENVPWDQAFAIILQTKGLWYERYGNIVRIAPAEKLKKERETAVATRRAAIEAKPLDVLFKPISYATAGELAARVKPILSSRGTVDIDGRTNTLIIRDVKEFLEAAKSLIEKLDTQTPQVSIEARIVEANTSSRKGWGIKWGGNLFFNPQHGNPTGLYFPNTVNVTNIAMNYPSVAGSNASAGIQLGSINGVIDLDLQIDLMEQEGDGKLIASPKVTVLDNASASIMSGVKIPYITQTSNSGSNVRFESAVISLSVTPHITADGSVFMKINATRNEPDFANAVGENPAISQRQISTEVLVKSGNTTVLGGIYRINKEKNFQGFPFLSRIPLLGYLFRNWGRAVIRDELLIFITPRIVGDERKAITSDLSG